MTDPYEPVPMQPLPPPGHDPHGWSGIPSPSPAPSPPKKSHTRRNLIFAVAGAVVLIAVTASAASGGTKTNTVTVAGPTTTVTVPGPTVTAPAPPATTITRPAPAPRTVTRTVAPPKPKAPPAPPPPAPFTGTTYAVTSDGGISNVTYSMPNFSQAQDTEVSGNTWSKRVDETVDYPSLVAQNAGGGTISCTITSDGQQLDHETSHGQYAVVTCNGG